MYALLINLTESNANLDICALGKTKSEIQLKNLVNFQGESSFRIFGAN